MFQLVYHCQETVYNCCRECECVFTYVCMYECIYVCVLVYVCMYYVCTYVCMYIHACIYVGRSSSKVS